MGTPRAAGESGAGQRPPDRIRGADSGGIPAQRAAAAAGPARTLELALPEGGGRRIACVWLPRFGLTVAARNDRLRRAPGPGAAGAGATPAEAGQGPPAETA